MNNGQDHIDQSNNENQDTDPSSCRFLEAEKGKNTGERHKNSHGKGQDGCGHSVGLSLKQIDKGIKHIQNGGDAQNDIENADDQACGFSWVFFEGRGTPPPPSDFFLAI